MPRRIFIASAGEDKDIAKAVATGLAKSGTRYVPLRWWDSDQFPPGTFTLEALLELSRTVDGAVFICTGTEKAWYRETEVTLPRDNVILEYGLFVSSVGQERALVVCQQGIKLPSDINAISYTRLLEDLPTVAEGVVDHFNKQFDAIEPLATDSAHVIADTAVVERQLGPSLPDEWYQRDLYIGIEGARAWMDVVRGTKYVPPTHERTLYQNLASAVKDLEMRTFVSLGPGDAGTDTKLAIKLKGIEPLLEYIPVDIGIGLLKRCIRRVGEVVRTPVGIFGDFEAGINFIHSQLEIHATRPMLLALLGNTIGNIDTSEEELLGALSNIMYRGDRLLLDAVIAGPKWTFSADRRASHKGYDLAFRRFIAQGVSRRSTVCRHQIVSEFDSRIGFRHGSGEVPKTNSVNITDASTGRHIQAHRRYDADSLVAWLKGQGFEIKIDMREFIDETIGHIVLLLSKR